MLCVFYDETVIKQLTPNMEKLKALDGLLLQVTAPGQGNEFDCVSRSFAPKLNVMEDPVCDSGHCHIVPFWANKLKRNEITAYQASERIGILYCRFEGQRVILAGKAALYSQGEIFVPENDTQRNANFVFPPVNARKTGCNIITDWI